MSKCIKDTHEAILLYNFNTDRTSSIIQRPLRHAFRLRCQIVRGVMERGPFVLKNVLLILATAAKKEQFDQHRDQPVDKRLALS